MERLTNPKLKMACDSFISFASREERTKYRMMAESAPKYEEIYKRLAEYEDAEEKAWTLLTDDEESYPECFEYVLVEDDIGDKNVACCHPDYEWFISNGEDSLKLIGNVIKWRNLTI